MKTAEFYLEKLETLADCQPGSGALATLDDFTERAEAHPLLWGRAIIAAGLHADRLHADPTDWVGSFTEAVEQMTEGENATYWEETYPQVWGS